MEESIEGAAPSVGELIAEAISVRELFVIRVGGLTLPITDTLLTMLVVSFLLAMAAWLATRRLRETPGPAQAALEWFVESIDRFAVNTIGRGGLAYAAWLGTLGLLLAALNLVELLSPLGGFGFEAPFTIKPAARDINIPAGLAVSTIAISIAGALKRKGLRGWLGSFLHPSPILAPLAIVELAVKPVSLSLRLFGNMLGAFVIMRLLEMLLPIGLPAIASLYFDLFDGALQTVIFTYLSAIYVAQATEQEH